jgi:hypothetical protein
MAPSPQHSRSRGPSRPSVARNTTASSLPYVPVQPESLILPDGPVGEDDAELLDELAHRRRETQDTLVGEAEDDDDHAKRRQLPWWKRPSPWWYVIFWTE